MNRFLVLKVHLVASLLATLLVVSFFLSSVLAEWNGDIALIKKVKAIIFFSLPVLFIVMPLLGISGKKLAGNSRNPVVLEKQKRMKYILLNGIVLSLLACFLFYRSHYQSIDNVFIIAQLIEFAVGLTNISLISLNIRSGLLLTGRRKKGNVVPGS